MAKPIDYQFILSLLPWVYIFIDLFNRVVIYNSISATLSLSSALDSIDICNKTESYVEMILVLKKEETFEYALEQSATDKKVHHYNFMYGPIFNPMKNKKLSFLEIGLLEGASLDLWNTFFTDAKIYGVDKGKSGYGQLSSRKFKNIEIFIGDQEDVPFLNLVSEKIRNEVGLLDFIIDNGGHTMSQQQTVSFILCPL